jgi:hypothetical protein
MIEMTNHDLQRPLLVAQNSAATLLSSDDVSQGRRLEIGMFLLSVSFLIQAVAADQEAHHNGTWSGWLQLCFAVVSTLALVTMTLADVDYNFYLRHRKMTVAWFTLAWATSWLVLAVASRPQPLSIVFLLPTVPFLYLLLRFTPVMEMKDGFPLFTELMVLCQALALFSTGVYWIGIARSSARGGFLYERLSWPDTLLGLGWLIGSVVLSVLAYQYARWNHGAQSASVQFDVVTYAFLLNNGMLFLFYQVS